VTAAPLRRNRDFMLLQTAQLLSSGGSQMTAIAYPLLVLALTGSAAKAGFVAAQPGDQGGTESRRARGGVRARCRARRDRLTSRGVDLSIVLLSALEREPDAEGRQDRSRNGVDDATD
jgi:hypothetical protein